MEVLKEWRSFTRTQNTWYLEHLVEHLVEHVVEHLVEHPVEHLVEHLAEHLVSLRLQKTITCKKTTIFRT